MDNDIMTINIPEGKSSGVLNFSNGGGGVVSLRVEWSSTPNTSSNSSTVSATMSLTANARGNALGGSHLTINGNRKEYSTHISTSGNSAVKHTLTSHTVNVPHNPDGTKTITISGALVWDGYMWNGSSVRVSTLSGSGNATLDTIDVGTAPTNANISLNKTGIVEGDVIATGSCYIASSAGTVYYKFAYSTDNGSSWTESNWQSNNSITYNITNISRGSTFQIRCKAKNNKGESGWSSSQSVKANSAPSKVTNVKCTPTMPSSYIDITWDPATDSDGHDITYHVVLCANNSCNTVNKTSATRYNYDCSHDAEGTVYTVKIQAHDSLGAYSVSDTTPQIVKRTPPSTPSFTSPNTVYYESGLTIQWTNSTFNTNSGEYVLERQVNGGTWTHVATIQSPSVSYNEVFDSANIARGDTVKYRVKAVNSNNLESGWAYSSAIKRNKLPSANINIRPKSSYLLNEVNLSWDASIDPDGHKVTYTVRMSKDNNPYIDLHNTTSTSYTWPIPSSDPGGTTYDFSIKITDEIGGYDYARGPVITKPKAPEKPTHLGPSTNSYESSITFNWLQGDWHGHTGVYILEIFVNNVSYKTVEIPQVGQGGSYTFDITNIERGSKITYRVRAKNTFGQMSDWSDSPGIYTRNSKPEPPTIIYPLPNANLYTEKPRIIFKGGYDKDGNHTRIYIKYRGLIYDSSANREYFNKSTIGFNEYIVFKTPLAMNQGPNVFEIWSHDSMIDSNHLTITYNNVCNISRASKDTLITASWHNDILTAINGLRENYGLNPDYAFQDALADYTVVTAQRFNKMRDVLLSTISDITRYQESLPLNPVHNIPAFKEGDLIEASSVNNIINAILDI